MKQRMVPGLAGTLLKPVYFVDVAILRGQKVETGEASRQPSLTAAAVPGTWMAQAICLFASLVVRFQKEKRGFSRGESRACCHAL
jgi:hypothetical protein